MNTQLITQEDFASVQEAQAGITKLFKKAGNKGKFVRIMRNQEPLGVLIPNNVWESLLEDFEASLSQRYRKDIAESRKSRKRYSSEEVKKMIGYR
jgi:PHD/YefM family antitoxin component YafN of YafNO toxin-antitoxin module